MSVESNRQINIQFDGSGFNENNSFAAASNTTSPAQQTYTSLASGANTLTVPSGATAVTLIPPAGNTTSITLKGVTGDTGVPLHLTDPSVIALATTATTLCVTASSTISGFRTVWS